MFHVCIPASLKDSFFVTRQKASTHFGFYKAKDLLFFPREGRRRQREEKAGR